VTDSNPTSKIIPNSFQTPNFFVDALMRYLSGNEQKCVDIVCRKTFGWQKRSDRISKSQLVDLSGLGEEAIDDCMAALVRFGVVLRISESVHNAGVEWAPQVDDSLIDMAGLAERDNLRREANRKRIEKALAKRAQGGDVQHTPHVQQPPRGDVQHTPQKPIKASSVVVVSGAAEIFGVYEQEFGGLTPLIADAIEDDCKTYPLDWIHDAMQIAVGANKRSWNYVRGILKQCKAKNVRPSLNRLEKSNGNNGTGNHKRAGKAETPDYTDGDRAAAERIKKRRSAVPAV
jgi:phage replication O-like protein O